MSYLRIQTQIVPLWNWSGSTAKLRIYASQQFFEATTGEMIPQGRVGNISSACQVINCTVSGTNLTIPEVTLATTTDSTVPNVTYTAVLYDSHGVSRYPLLSQFFVDPSYLQVPAESSVLVTDAGTSSVNAYYTFRGTSAGYNYYNVVGQSSSVTLYALVNTGTQWRIYDATGTNQYHTSDNAAHPWDAAWTVTLGDLPVPTVSESATTVTSTWEQLTISNQAAATVGAPYQWNAPFWSVDQTKQYINSLVGAGTTPYASSLAAGKTYLSEDPAIVSHPEAVGTNDAHWLLFTNVKYLSVDYADDLATAVTAIGATPTQLFITETTASVVTNISTPSTLLLTFADNGLLTVANTKTVTIGLMSPAPSKQIFTGAGQVYLAKNAVPEKDLSWWAGNSSTADLSSQFGQMFTNAGRCFVPSGVWKCTNVTIPSYTHLYGTGSGADATNGTVIQIYNLAASTSPLKVSEAFRHITIENLTLSVLTSTTASPFIAQGTAPNTAVGLFLKNVAFYGTGTSAPAQFYIKDIAAGQWQLEECYLQHCEWVVPASGRGVTIESVNTSVTITQGLFGGGANFTAIYGYHIGFLTLIQCQCAGVGLSAVPWSQTLDRTITQASITSGTKNLSIATGAFSMNDLGRHVTIGAGVKLDSYITEITSLTTAKVADNALATATNEAMAVSKWTANAARGNIFLHIVNSHACINIQNCTDEGMNYFLVNDVSDLLGVINLTNNWVQSWIQLNQACTINSNGNHYFAQTWRDDTPALARIISSGDLVTDVNLTGTLVGTLTLLAPAWWGQHLGGSILQTSFNNNYNTYRQNIELPTTINYGQGYAPSPDTTNGLWTMTSSLDTTGGPHIKLIEYGRSDAVTEKPLYTYKIERNFDTGFSVTTGTQTAPYAGWQYDNGPIVADVFVGNVVSPAAITTDAGTYYPLEYKQNIRMDANADHTIGGLVFAAIDETAFISGIPGMKGTHAYLWNISAFNITFLHQSGGANANERFICDTGANIVCLPNEIIHVVRDGTTARWRISKGNITGLTSDGSTITAAGDFVADTLAVNGDSVFDGFISIGGGAVLATSNQSGSGSIVMSDSPTLTGTPLTPTAAANTATAQIATTAFVGLLRSYLATTVTYNNNAALGNTALSVTVAASGLYKIELTIFSTSAVKGLNLDFAGTSTQTAFIGEWWARDATTIATTACAKTTAAGTDFGPAGMDGIAASIYTFTGSVNVNAGGTFILRGAQNSANASDTAILVGSNLLLTKLN